MTACTNRGGKAGRVITAALVATLSVGAPVVALATTADAAAGDVQLMALDSATIQRADVEYKGGEPAKEYTYTGRGLGPVPVTINPVNEDSEDIIGILPSNTSLRVKGGFYYYYVAIDGTSTFSPSDVSYVNDKGNTVSVEGTQVKDADGNFVKPTKAGKYVVLVGQWNGGSDWTYVSAADAFDIVGQSLDAATLVDGLDATDTTFNYTGETGSTKVSEILDRIHVSLDGYILKDTDVSLELWEKGGTSKISDDTEIAIGKTYIVKVNGTSAAFAGQKIEREFTLGKLDLSSSVVLGSVFTEENGEGWVSKDTKVEDAVASINGVTNLNWGGLNYNGNVLDFTFVSDPSGNQTSSNEKGAYTFTLKATDDNPNVTGECTVTVMAANYEAAVNYGGKAAPQSDGSYFVDLSASKPAYFDIDDINVTYKWGEVPAEGYKITDAAGNEVSDMTQPGTYTVVVKVDWTNANDQLVAGSKMFKVVVAYTVDLDTDVFLSYKNENVETDARDTYTGSDLSDNFSAKVIVSNGTVLEQGKDYELVFQKVQDDGKVVDVDEIVDAGYYNVIVRGITFSGDYLFDFTVDPIKITSVGTNAPYVEDGHPAFAYTGDVIVPEFIFGEDVLTSDLYEVEYIYDVDGDGKGERTDLKEMGVYVAHLTTAEGVTNYDIDATLTIKVTDTGIFADVANDQWYSKAVYDASGLEYMTGYDGTAFFGPTDSIKRGDVAMVLYKMSGNYAKDVEEGLVDANKAYNTDFSDVNGHAYYAKAIQWAAKLGIVSGDDNAGTFRPEDSVTREELAKMLYKYSELQNKTTDVDADVILAEYEDEGTVSEWAREYVAWMVDQDVMGQDSGLKGNQAISRAEVAAMTVRLQPEGKLDGFMRY